MTINIFIIESRLIQYLYGVWMFVLIVSIIFFPNPNVYFLIVGIFGILFRCVVRSFPFLIIVGNFFDIVPSNENNNNHYDVQQNEEQKENEMVSI